MSKQDVLEAVDYMHRVINAAVFGIPGEQLPELHEKLDLIRAELTKESVPVDAVPDPIDTMFTVFDKMNQQADEILQAIGQATPLNAEVQEAFERLYSLSYVTWIDEEDTKNADLALLELYLRQMVKAKECFKKWWQGANTVIAAERLAHEQTRKERDKLAAKLTWYNCPNDRCPIYNPYKDITVCTDCWLKWAKEEE